MEGTCVSVVLRKRLEGEREEYEVRGVKQGPSTAKNQGSQLSKWVSARVSRKKVDRVSGYLRVSDLSKWVSQIPGYPPHKKIKK